MITGMARRFTSRYLGQGIWIVEGLGLTRAWAGRYDMDEYISGSQMHSLT